MARKPEVEGRANRLSNSISAILKLSIRVFTIRIRKPNLFQNSKLLDIPDKRLTRLDHELPFMGEIKPQRLVDIQWNPNARQEWLLDCNNIDNTPPPESPYSSSLSTSPECAVLFSRQ